MQVVHTLLFMLRPTCFLEDLMKADACLKSLEKSTHKTVIIYNQGFWNNDALHNYLQQFALECIVIGNGENVGIVAGRQTCFQYIWSKLPQADMISELHLDMVFTYHWEDPLVAYLEAHDQSMISCGMIDRYGILSELGAAPTPLPENKSEFDVYLASLRKDLVVHGFTHPAIHDAKILQRIGGYDVRFLPGKQAFEDDSILLGYFYYHGTAAQWTPKICYHSVIFHEYAGQRMGVSDDIMINYHGLVRQYGAMGIYHLSQIHTHPWSKQFFKEKYEEMCGLPSPDIS